MQTTSLLSTDVPSYMRILCICHSSEFYKALLLQECLSESHPHFLHILYRTVLSCKSHKELLLYPFSLVAEQDLQLQNSHTNLIPAEKLQ